MTERRTRTVARIRTVCGAAAALVLAVLLAPPATAGVAPLFDVSVSPTAAVPGQDVVVSLSPLDERLDVTSCRAGLAGREPKDCVETNGHWSARLTLPHHLRAGSATLAWSLGYRLGTGRAAAHGTTTLTIVQAMPPDFSVAIDPAAARPGDTVTARFTALGPKTTITNCSARLGSASAFDCRGSGPSWSLTLTVPTTAHPSSSPVEWTLVYERGGYQSEARGKVSFTILHPVTASGGRAGPAAPTESVPAASAPTPPVPTRTEGPAGDPAGSRATATGLSAWDWDESDPGVLALGLVVLVALAVHAGRGHLRRTASGRLGQLAPAASSRRRAGHA